MINGTRVVSILSLLCTIGCDSAFEVEYVDCKEFAGVGIVPLANVEELVPADYTIVEGAPGQAVVVAQSGSCTSIVVDGIAKPGIFAQFGVAVQPPLAPGSGGDFYQLLFSTDRKHLAHRMSLAGVDARYSPNLSYEINDGPELSIDVPKPVDLAFELNGPITLPSPMSPPMPMTTFNYYAQSSDGTNILQQNNVEGIRLGTGAGVTLTAQGDQMQAIVGGDILMFPLFSNPEIFDITTLSVEPGVF